MLDFARRRRNLAVMTKALAPATLTLSASMFLLAALPVRADERILQFLEDRYTHALMHQAGDVANGEPLALGLANCVDKRALNRKQRNLARRLGRIFERAGVHIDLIAASPWCRAIETAKTLKLRPVSVEPALIAAEDSDEDAVEAALEILDSMRRSETALLVTHGSNIRGLTGRASKPGEVIVVRLRPGADLEIIGAFVPE